MVSKKGIILGILILSVVIFLLARRTTMPFVIAAAFAYFFNPVVNFVSEKLKIDRLLAIILLYVVLIAFLAVIFSWLIFQIVSEASELSKTLSINDISSFSEGTIRRLPEWTIYGQSFGLQTIMATIINTLITAASRIKESILPIFTGALGYVLQVLVFLIASFYFLKDGPEMIKKIMVKLPFSYKKEFQGVAHDINEVLGGYLRGQIVLIIIMGTITSIFLSLLGVKFAITLGILTGFFELVPFIGPVVAGTLAAGTAFITGNNRFGLDPVTLFLIIGFFYFVARQVEDYFVTPQIMGRLTRLHPVVVLFSVLTGGAIAGTFGFILGVPIAASIRVILAHTWNSSEDS